MGYLDQVTDGVVPKKELICVFGVPGVGKTTFGTSFPKSIIEDVESGSHHIKCKRMPSAKNYREVLAHMAELINTEHAFESFVFDSLDHFEAMINATVCEENGWKSIDEGAFGKGYAAALTKWQEFMGLIKKLNEKMNVILIAHSVVKTINDPMKQQPYDRHEIKLQTKSAALIKEHVDAILFCTFEILLRESKMPGGKAKALDSKSVPVMYTQSRPSHEAKNRFGLPYKLPLVYEAYVEARAKNQLEEAPTLLARIQENLDAVKDPELKAKVVASLEKANGDTALLSKILNRLEVINSN